MRLLLLDTCGASGSVALTENGVMVAGEVMPGRSASEQLIPVIRAMLADRGWTLGELAAIVVVHGPGSFTGVRVGVSAAKGLSEAVNVPLVAVSRLEVLAVMAGGGCVALDAGRGEFYIRVAGGESLATREELFVAVGEGDLVLCELRVAEAFAAFGFRSGAVRVIAEPTARDALPVALERIATGRFEDAAVLDAHYLRRSEGLFGRIG